MPWEAEQDQVAVCSAASIDGIANFGDELLTELYCKWIDESAANTQAKHLKLHKYGVLDRDAKEALDQAGRLVFTGGGYFADGDVGGNRIRSHLRALRNKSVYGNVFSYANKVGIPCAVMGLEVGPLANLLYRHTVRRILAAAEVVVVRNEESRANIGRMWGESIEVSVHLDAALAITSAQPRKASVNGATGTSDGRDLKVGLHIHSLEDGDVAPDGLARLVQTIGASWPSVSRLRLFYLHDQTKEGTHPTRSLRAEEALRQRLPPMESIAYRNPAATIREIGGMDLIVTSKLHVGIVARGLGVPVLAIGKLPKIARFYEEIGESWASASVGTFVSEGLPDPLIRAELEGERLRMPVGSQYKASALRNRSSLERFLGT